MHLVFKYSVFLIAVCCLHATPCISQKKKTELKKKLELSHTEHNPPAKKEVIQIIHEVIPAKEKQKTEEMSPLYETKETVIIIKGPKTETKKQSKKTDTVIVFVKDTTKTKPATNIVQKPITEKPLRHGQESKTAAFEMDTEGNCGCTEMTVKTSDTLEYQQYITYMVKFKNNCKETIYINSGSFRFVPFNYFGYPVRTLRKISFVKRFDLPAFVKLEPNETYEFRFADDPFFEFDLHRHEQYKFSFIHNNKTLKYKPAPSKTFLCSRYEDKMIFIK